MKKIWLSLIGMCGAIGAVNAQGTLTGDLQMNVNFFQRDSSIGATVPALYDRALSGGEGWMSLRYNYKGFTAFARIDAFQNSNLQDPNEALTAFGIGAFSLSKEFKGLTITGGYIYDQIGSGILFRAYEDRGLLIDNALVGLHLKYKLTDNVTLKGFTGQQKALRQGSVSGRFDPVIKGVNAEGDFSVGKAHIIPGIGAINRTLDKNSLDAVKSTIESIPDLSQRFVPRYNMYAFTAYNTLTIGSLSWFAEGSYKTHEAIDVNGMLMDKAGSVVYSTLGYARKGLAVNLSGKRTENYAMRTSPRETQLYGMLNWQPMVARLRPQRLMARYTPATQDISEPAGGIDVLVSPNDNLDFTLNYTHINTLGDVKLYREAYAEVQYRSDEKWRVMGGVQYMEYNQEIYQLKPKYDIVKAITPFAEVTYLITPKKSIRVEVEYQHTEQDFGSWAYILAEYNIAPRWSFTVADMINMDPKTAGISKGTKAQHYPNVFLAHTQGPHRFSIAYVKQTEGINCTGGVCRYEPAFSGVRIGVNSSF
jgi:hypothetical protein